MVRPRVIGGDVDRGDIAATLRLDAADEGIGVGRKAIVGRQGEKRGVCEAGRSTVESDRLAEGADFNRHTLGGDVCQRSHVVRHQRDKTIVGQLGLFAHVRGGANDRTDQAAVVCCGVHDDPTAHAVTGHGDPSDVDAEPRCVHRIAEIRQDGIRILEVL